MANEKKTKSKGPLLYVHQPNLQGVKSKMQSSYRSPKSNPETTNQKGSVSNSKRNNKENLREDVQSIKAEIEFEKKAKHDAEPKAEQEEKKTGDFGFTKVKPFREMDLNEKLEYLTDFGDGKAPFPCVFGTESDSYKGIIFSVNGTEIEIKQFHGDNVKLNRSEITSIKMIGL